VVTDDFLSVRVPARLQDYFLGLIWALVIGVFVVSLAGLFRYVIGWLPLDGLFVNNADKIGGVLGGATGLLVVGWRSFWRKYNENQHRDAVSLKDEISGLRSELQVLNGNLAAVLGRVNEHDIKLREQAAWQRGFSRQPLEEEK